jgi:curved DNA-binding protein CbpA
VLGVNVDDDYSTIKKAYRKLVREFHPDLHPENIEKFTEITQSINNAWEKVSSWKK